MEKTQLKVFEIIPPIVQTLMTVIRGKRKISTEQLVIEFFKGFSNNIEEIYIGKTKLLIILSRVSPKIADRILKNN